MRRLLWLVFFLTAAAVVQAADPATVKERKDETYYAGENADAMRHRLDLYLPDTKKPFPLVLFIHGGAWRSGTKDLYGPMGRQFAARGIGVAVANYRLSPAVKHPEHIKDVARAFAWVEKRAASLGADPERLYLCGHSAGAHLVTLLALDPRYLRAEKVPAGRIRGVVGISGPYNLGPRGFPEVFGDDAAARADAFPLNHVSDQPATKLPPFLLMVAERDYAGLPLSATGLEQALQRHGAKAQRHEIADTDHITIIVKTAQPDSAVSKSIVDFIRP